MTMNIGTYNNNCNSLYGNSSDCYSNAGFEHYQYHHHHPCYQDQVYPHAPEYSGPPNRIETLPKQYNNAAASYYDSMITNYEYNNGNGSNSDLSSLRRSEEPPYYSVQHQHYHQQDDVNIITSANGLSYTNLDYSNSDNYSYHQKNASSPKEYKEYVNFETLDSNKRETETRGAHSHDECGSGSGADNLEYLPVHQSAISAEPYQSSTYNSTVKEEAHYHAAHTASSAPLTALPDYSHQPLPLHHIHQTSHLHHQSQHVTSSTTQSQSAVPTYKWMQVKRNVPKPGEYDRDEDSLPGNALLL